MATRGKAISVKIATPKVIKALEGALAKLELDYTSQEANEVKYEKARKAWQKEVMDFAIANIKKSENLRTNYRAWNSTLNIDFDLTVPEKDLPKEPTRDFEKIHQHEYNSQKEEIANAIRILKMTDEEVATKFVESIEVSLPPPDTTSIKEQREAFTEQTGFYEEAIEHFFNADMLTEEDIQFTLGKQLEVLIAKEMGEVRLLAIS